ncbi:MAG: hypothetical protein EOP64_06990 [Sphingomonas sp.]|nr:MAG: hypothetical protein EOP64_06990 [Sphingomonas sp.]
MSSTPTAPLVDAPHTTDGWKSLDTEHPTYASACRCRCGRRSLASVLDGDAASVLPVPGLFVQVAACAGYAATRSEDLVDQIRTMIDVIGAEGAPTDHPAAMVRLCATVQALLDDIATFGLSAASTVAAGVVTSAPDTT